MSDSLRESDEPFDWHVEDRPALITGGAGFIGSNVADALLSLGQKVIVYDNLSRNGVEQNLEWLRSRHGERLEVAIADIRDRKCLREQVCRSSKIFHFAAQVAVTTSITDPEEDFEINARGTFNLLEAMRIQDTPPSLLFTSTNKVYGSLDDIELRYKKRCYDPENSAIRHRGISEDRPLEFHSPYGCSKGAADQYVLDSFRSHGLKTAVLRMSCIYGPRQFGTEDQGWVAHFLIQALLGRPITLYGDGRQVRDILYVSDLVRAMLLAHCHIDQIAGAPFNIGGGVNNAISLLDLLEMIKSLTGTTPKVLFEDWRLGDQRYYVSDTIRFQHACGWTPEVTATDGVARLYRWLLDNRSRILERSLSPRIAVGVA